MIRYQTEIVIPPDRYVSLQLPAALPEGRATVTVIFQDAAADSPQNSSQDDPESQDIEWWEEFDGDDERVA